MKIIFSAFLLFIPLFVHADLAADLLKESDRYRGGLANGVFWQARLQTTENNKTSDRVFNIKAKGVDALVEAVSPAKSKGEVFLFNDRTTWFFKPGLKKPVAISARQKLVGQAANGDIASTNYARDYTPQIEREEKVGDEMAHVLLLKAKSDQVTYDQIRYWVSSSTKRALKAEFMTLQGVPFKRATFEYKNTIAVDGKKIPFISRMTIVDAKFEKNQTVMDYTETKPQSHPAAIFNINNLSR